MIPGIELTQLIQNIGLVGIILMVFLESGVPIGFIFPGDSLLITAGVLGAAGLLNIQLLIIGVFVAAVLGVNAGYYIGKKYGIKMFSNEQSRIFNPRNIKHAESFYESHGGKAIVLARFIPVVRTFAPIVAGIAHMNYKKFMIFNIIGALIWAVGVTMLGYALGNTIGADVMEKYLILIILSVIALSFIPAIVHLVLNRRRPPVD